MLIYNAIVQAQVLGAQGQFDAACTALTDAAGLTDWPGLQVWQTRLWLARGAIGAAAYWLQQLEAGDGQREVLFVERTTQARVLIAQGERAAAEALLTSLIDAAQAAQRIGDLIELLALRSIAQYAGGDHDEALATLAQAMKLAVPEQPIRVFVDEGAPMRTLLTMAQQRGIGGVYTQRLLAAFGAAADIPSAREPSASDHRPLVEPLSEREHEVLQLLGVGFSNRQIADTLVITLGTAKWHVHNILGKLGARNRTQAIRRAQALKIL